MYFCILYFCILYSFDNYMYFHEITLNLNIFGALIRMRETIPFTFIYILQIVMFVRYFITSVVTRVDSVCNGVKCKDGEPLRK
jgi:hypothetical protein